MGRYAHQCHKNGCDSEAKWRMCVKFTTRTPQGVFVPIDAPSTLLCCDRHREAAAYGFMSERNLDSVSADLAKEGLAAPHPNAIQIEFERYEAPAK